VRYEDPLDLDHVPEKALVAPERIERGGVGVARYQRRSPKRRDSVGEAAVGEDLAVAFSRE